MSVTSASPADLAQFEARSARKRVALEELRASAGISSSTVHAASADFHPEVTFLGGVAALIGNMLHLEQFVGAVHDSLVRADCHTGQPVVDDSVITSELRQRGLLGRPSAVQLEEMAVYGIPPTSGFVDDPVCAANGNFVHHDVDLAFPGFASCLDLGRVYNSLGHRLQGVFGPGWSSLLDMRVSAVADEPPVVFLADGAAITFPPDEDAGYLPDQRRRLTLLRDGDGWELRGADETVWSFGGTGALTGLARGAARAVVKRLDDGFRLQEQLSGRALTYRLAFGRVMSARAGDGRECRYRYDAEGHLLAVERPSGGLSYAVDGGLVVAVVDADKVALCRNEYDGDGRVLRQTSPHGRTSIYEYDDLATTRVSDTDHGPVNVLVHDRHGNLTSLIDGHGNDMRLRYDADGRVARLVDRLGHTTRYEYTEPGRLTRRLDPDGAIRSWFWDDQGRLQSDTDRAGGTTTYEYAGSGRTPARVVTADGGVIRTTLDERGLPISVTDPDGVVTGFGWTADGLLAAVVDALGNRHSFQYDDRGLLVEARNPSEVTARFTLDAAGRVVESETTDGTQRFTYSPAGRLTECVETDGGVWRFDYGPSGEVERLTDALGAALALERDTHGNITTFVAPDGAVYRHTYDELGRLVAAEDPAGGLTRLEYDAEGRSIAVIDASGRQWRRAVNSLGRTVRMTAPDGTTSTRSYHANGELAAATDAEGRTWQNTVDPVGRLLRTLDPAGGEHAYAYSAAGRPVMERSPGGRTLQRSYDAAGRLAGLVDRGRASTYRLRPDGQVRLWRQGGSEYEADYDDSGRPTSLRGPGVEFVQRWAHGRVIEAGTSASRSRFDWDVRGHLASATDAAGVGTAFSYDARGRLVAQVTGDHSTRAQFDEVGHLRQVFDSLGHHTALSADAAGRTTQVDLPDGRSLRYTHTPLGLPESVSTGGDGTMLAQFAYDATGYLREATSGTATTRVERDAVGRVHAVAGPGYTLRYERDLDGLVLSVEDESGFAIRLERSEPGDLEAFRLRDGAHLELPQQGDLVRDELGRITRDEHAREYSYDAAGRLVESMAADGEFTTYSYGSSGLLEVQRDRHGVQQFRYNAGGQLIERTGPSADVEYTYDETGRRTGEMTSDRSAIDYEWDPLDRLVTIARRGADGRTRLRSITYDAFNCPVLVDGVPVAWDLPNSGKAVRVGESRYLRVGLHVREVEDGAEWQTMLPDDPWGHDGGTGVRLGFRGELAVDGLVLMGARVYDPASRSFLSPDPAEPVPGALTFAGPYSYARNDPVNLVDPSGLRPISEAEYEEIRRRQDQGTFERAWDVPLADPWKQLAVTGTKQFGSGLRESGLVDRALGFGRAVGVAGVTWAAHVGTQIDSARAKSGAIDPSGWFLSAVMIPVDFSRGSPGMGGATPFPQPSSFPASAEATHSPAAVPSLTPSPRPNTAPTPPPPGPSTGVDQVHPVSWRGLGHGLLDVVGLVPGFGEPADGINAVWYAAEGDWANAGMSAAGMFPFIGMVATGGKVVGKGAEAAKAARGAEDKVGDLPTGRSADAPDALPRRDWPVDPQPGTPEYDLGFDPAKKKFRQSEYETATRIMDERGVELFRAPKGSSADWVDASGNTYDAVGNFPAVYFERQWHNFSRQITRHLDVKADLVPVDVSTFSPDQIVRVQEFIAPLGPRVFIVGG